MKVGILHNEYIHRGGEDVSVEQEKTILSTAGVDVDVYRATNRRDLSTALQGLTAALTNASIQGARDWLKRLRPDILHIHNLYPLLSASIAPFARSLGIKVVATLHNFRPLCLNGLFLTPQKEICERCAGGNVAHGIVRGCYRSSRLQSMALGLHIARARAARWYDAVDRFIAPAAFLRDKFCAYGFPSERFSVQGHCLWSMPAEAPEEPQPYVLYLGRLSEEKGVVWLLETFRNPAAPFQLKVAGDGPLEPAVRASAGASVEYVGRVSGETKDKLLRQAAALVMPSDCYENFPLAVPEANAQGTPAFVAGHGGMAELVGTGVNGGVYVPKDRQSFWRSLEPLLKRFQNLADRQRCQAYAREQFSTTRFTASRLALYREVLGDPAQPASPGAAA